LLAFVVLSLRRRLLRLIAKHTTRAPVPLIVVGNLYIGGTGKTPIVIAILEELRAKGWRPGVIIRGYEPALIAQEAGAPISVHPNRRLAWQALMQAYPQTDVIVSDDGLQHATLMRDLELLVQDVRGVGNGWLLPAGPLRDPPSRLCTVDALITRLTETEIAPPSLNLAPKELVARMRISGFQQLQGGQRLDPSQFLKFCANKSLAAFAGIGAPERFFADLRALGLQVPLTTGLPDHCAFNANTLDAPEADLVLITSKDAIKCKLLRDNRIWVAQTHSTFSDPRFADWLHERLRRIQTALR
jgi:tetraacyldisaccharide 4'-kinase